MCCDQSIMASETMSLNDLPDEVLLIMTSETMSLNDLPDEVLLQIFSHFGPEDLCLIIAEVCERWNSLAKDVVLWRTLSYECKRGTDISRIAEVRCTALLGFSTKQLTNFAPSSVLTFIVRAFHSAFGFTGLNFPLNRCACLTASVYIL